MRLDLMDPYGASAGELWRTLDAATPRSFFVSWGWIENWLACVPRDVEPHVAVVRDDAGLALAAFCVVRRTEHRLPMLASRALYMNATGVPRLDNVWIEYNGLVGQDVSLGRLVDLLGEDWDELFMPGLPVDAFGGIDETVFRGFRVRVERSVPSYYVDLARVRDGGYLALLGGQTRAQIRRAQREAGPLEVDVAADPDTALSIYREIVGLHQRQWQARGKPGAWADPWFDRFHRRLIAHRFAHGEIQLIRVRSPRGTIGALYNFVHRGRVLQYQSGLGHFDDARLKAGYVTHAAAIEHGAAAGHAVYDFLAGEMRYKQSLSTDQARLQWVRLQRPRMRFLLEDQLRVLARQPWMARVRAAVAPGPTHG